MNLRYPFVKLISFLQRMPTWQFWLGTVVSSLVISEAVVMLMEWLLLGRITQDYLLTGMVTSVLVSSLVAAIILYSSDQVRMLAIDLAATLQAIPDLLFELSEEGEYINVWARDPELLAAQKEILLGHTVSEILSLDAANTVMSAIQKAKKDGYSVGQTIHINLPQGDRWFELSTSLKAATGHSSKCFIMLSRDITERKLAEAALQQKHIKLLETQRELIKAHDSLAEADRLESVGRLAAGVAHEVKNPLAIIRLGIDYLSDQVSQKNDQEVVDDVKGAIDRAEIVISDLLDFSRQKQFDRRPTNINQVIDKAIQLVRHLTKNRNITIAINYNDHLPPIHADPDRLVHVFINLFANAAQAIGHDGSIEVVTRSMRLSESDLERSERGVFEIGDLVIAVDIRDNGPGFLTEHKKKLFEPFFTTKPAGEGSGLGLSVSRNIVIMHDGTVDIANRPEGGASTLLIFPADPEYLTNEKANTDSR